MLFCLGVVFVLPSIMNEYANFEFACIELAITLAIGNWQ